MSNKLPFHYVKRAKEKERSFLKKLKEGHVVVTGMGKLNFVQRVSTKSVHLRSTKPSKRPITISREMLREAMAYLYYKRTATRKDLERFTSGYNSSLMGLLRLIFADIARMFKTVRGLLRLSLKGTRYYFSGCSRAPSDMEIVTEHEGLVLMSYFHLREDETGRWLYHVRKQNQRVLLDSGAFSLFAAQLDGKEVQPINIKDYCEFIKQHQDVLIGYFNLDVIGDAKKTEENLRYMQSQGLSPIPVYHVQSPIEELDRIVAEDYEIIAIGGSVFLPVEERRKAFEAIFARYPAQNFHLLGGSSHVLFEFPFFQTDSTAWLNGRKNRTLITLSGYMPAPKDWTSDECLYYNVAQMSKLEESYHGSIQLNLLIPPRMKHPRVDQIELTFAI